MQLHINITHYTQHHSIFTHTHTHEPTHSLTYRAIDGLSNGKLKFNGTKYLHLHNWERVEKQKEAITPEKKVGTRERAGNCDRAESINYMHDGWINNCAWMNDNTGIRSSLAKWYIRFESIIEMAERCVQYSSSGLYHRCFRWIPIAISYSLFRMSRIYIFVSFSPFILNGVRCVVCVCVHAMVCRTAVVDQFKVQLSSPGMK